jgi:histidinol-phosphatase
VRATRDEIAQRVLTPLAELDMQADLNLAFELVDLAASISLPRFEAQEFTVTIKPDGSPVTEVDVTVEDVLRRRLARERPDHMITGEERGTSGSSSWRWYLDPIDGTQSFVSGDPKWMTLIALAHDDRIVLGVVDVPARGQRWWGSRGGGAHRDGQRISVSDRRPLEQAVVNDTWDEDLAQGNREHPLFALAQRAAGVRPHQDDGFLAVAAGEADVAVHLGGAAWDHAPQKVIVEEAGGRLTDFAGTDRIDTGRVVATNGLIHQEVLDLLA